MRSQMTAPGLPDLPDAACRGMDQAIFYPERGQDAREAKAVCAGCPERAACLEWAISHGEQHGIWGGLSFRQRLTLRRVAA